MSDVFTEIGMDGTLQRPTYDVVTGLPSGTVYAFKMGLVREQFAVQLEGMLNTQKFVALLPKRLAEAQGWTHGAPVKGDIIVIDGQRTVVQHTLDRGYADDLIWFCQVDG